MREIDDERDRGCRGNMGFRGEGGRLCSDNPGSSDKGRSPPPTHSQPKQFVVACQIFQICQPTTTPHSQQNKFCSEEIEHNIINNLNITTMSTIKTGFINLDVKNFADEVTGELIEHYQLNVADAIPCKKRNADGVIEDSEQTFILKKSNQIRAMLQQGSKKLAALRSRRGGSFDAPALNALLEGATLEISAEPVAAGTTIEGYTYAHDTYRYSVVSIAFAPEIEKAIDDSKKLALAKALGL